MERSLEHPGEYFNRERFSVNDVHTPARLLGRTPTGRNWGGDE